MRLNLPVYTYSHRSQPASTARLVNCYPELMPPGGKTPVLLTRSPGVKAWSTAGSGSIKGMYRAKIGFETGRLDRLYAVSGRELYSIDADKNKTLLGDIGTANRIDFAHNGDSLALVNEPRGYYYDGVTFAQILASDFTARGGASVEFLENWILFREPDSDRMFGANLGTVTDYDALDFVNSDTNPDLLVDMITDRRSLLCFSEETTEFFENTGVSGFPFERNINGTMQVGIAGPGLVGRSFDVVYFIADDLTVRRVEGIQPVKISTHWVERFLEKATISSGRSFSYNQEGHFFMGFSFTEGTIIFDAVTQEWSERKSYREEYWRPSFITKFDGKWLAGDPLSNAIVEIDLETYTDSLADQYTASTVQRMEWTYQPVYAEGIDAFHDRLEVVFNAGAGTTLGQGKDPHMMMSYSDDSGLTWNALPDRAMGKKGKFFDRVVWHNLGKSKARVYRGAVTDPVLLTIEDTIIEVRGGRL